MKRVKIGLIGCGNISGQYLKYCRQFDILEVDACSDLDMSKAKARAEEYGVPRVLTVEQLLADPEIELVVNLTVPAVHAEVSMRAIEHGKHVYVEKPLSVDLAEGQQLLQMAAERGLLVGCAPDTVLGAGLQTCRKLIDEGKIGEPVSAVAFMLSRGPEGWHPDPEFFYKRGAGPMFDMGPYYLTALVQLFGPMASISAMTKSALAERVIGSEPKRGQRIKVETPTYVAGNIAFHNGAIATMITSFDTFGRHHLPNIEIYGTEGTIRVPDPNIFGGDIFLNRHDQNEWERVAYTHPYADSGRGLGVADMAYAIRNGRAHRASGDIGYHVLEAMHGFHIAADQQKHYMMQSRCERPQAMPVEGLRE